MTSQEIHASRDVFDKIGDQAIVVTNPGPVTIHQVGNPSHNIPLQRPPRAKHFTDRESELAQLLDNLRPGCVETLCGPGGIGKSALAAEAVWKVDPKRFPDGIIFHTFYGQLDPNLALEHIARSFGVEPQPTAASAALRALAGKCALLVLDGTEEARDLNKVLEIRGNCAVIVTSRKRMDAVAEPHNVKPLPPNEAVTLLHAWSGHRISDDSIVRCICELVGGLPLAVRLIGRYLVETDETGAEYLDWLRQQPLAALNHGKHRDESVYVLLTRSLEQLSENAGQVLAIFGLLAIVPVSQVVIQPALLDMELRHPLNELVGYGMLARIDGHYAVTHALIRTYLRERCPVPEEVVERIAAYY
ncbi:hypothetical protein CCP3SC1_10084 [Gammaproteobacteria bacterium]